MILLLSSINILCNCVYLLLAFPAIQLMLQLGKINKHLSIYKIITFKTIKLVDFFFTEIYGQYAITFS